MSMTTRQLIGSIGGHESWARTSDRTQRTAPGRAAFMARFEREVDPDGTLPEAERLRRAENAKSAYYKRLALKSASTRRRRTEAIMPQTLDQLLKAMRSGRKPPTGERWFSSGCCICGATSSTVTDHDHATGIVRGTLCRSCNTLEGQRSDSDDFGLWLLWREQAPGLQLGVIYVPPFIQHWLDAQRLAIVATSASNQEMPA